MTARSAYRWLMSCTVVIAALLVLALQAGTAQADTPFGFDVFDAAVTDSYHQPLTQAGAHPYDADVRFTFNVGPGREPVKDTTVDTPPGFVGNPTAVDQCDLTDLSDYYIHRCPATSQVGVAATDGPTNGTAITYPVYALRPQDGVAAQFGFVVDNIPIILTATVRPEDYGLRVTSRYITSQFSPVLVSVRFWGVPGDPRHDAFRRTDAADLCGGDPTDVAGTSDCPITGGDPVTLPATTKAFLSNPSDCSAGPLTTSIAAVSWAHPEAVKTASVLSHDNASPSNPVGLTGCENLTFEPSASVQPSTTTADTPAGLTVKLRFPTDGLINPNGVAEPPLKKAVVTLPEGMTVNPASADGLDVCADGHIGFGTDQVVDCPGGSKIGTVTASTPVLEEPVTGAVYLRPQASSDPESGDMFRIVMVLKNDKRGLLFKLPGSIRADKTTGRLVTTFDNNPQQPVSDLSLTLKSGPRAPLVTPATCGTKTTDIELTSWAGQTVVRHDSFDVRCTGGLGGFAPAVTAGAVDPTGGASSPFALSITKPDGNSAVNGLTMSLPTGLLARLKGNLNSQVGTVKAFAGPGSNPFMLPGKVFLEGQYGDAPFSLRVVVPAKAGPFDLGEVTVRQKIYVDPIDAHVTVVSDPLPTIVAGVPVRLQRLDVAVDRPGFMLNPTSCETKAIGGTLSSAAAQTAPINVRFQMSDCSSLELKPSLALSLSGKGQTTDGKHPAVSATLTQKPGQANLKKVRVALPLSLALDPDNANGLCEFVDGTKATPTCPKASIVGTATAVTPILDEPLTGPVYFVKDVRNDPKSGRPIKTTPKLVIPLVGQNGVKLTLTGRSTVVDDRLVTTFDDIPDAPVSSFKLNIIGGKGGILVVSSADICKSTQIAEQQIDGQNNKAADADVSIQTPSCPRKIISKKVGKKSVALKIGGLGAGKVTVTGKGIKKTTKTITKSTVATVTAKRTGKTKPGAFKVTFSKAKAAATA